MSGTGRLVIVSGPSGSGKTTVVSRLFRECTLPLVASVSATTRTPRAGEIDGQNYHFLTQEEFASRRERGDFLECCRVFGHDHWYGTLREEVERGLAAGRWVLLEIDVQGMESVIRNFPAAITIFIHPGSMEELTQRLKRRGTETTADLERRLAVAKHELEAAPRYHHQVFNHEVERAVQEICDILKKYEDEPKST